MTATSILLPAERQHTKGSRKGRTVNLKSSITFISWPPAVLAMLQPRNFANHEPALQTLVQLDGCTLLRIPQTALLWVPLQGSFHLFRHRGQERDGLHPAESFG